MKRRGFFQLIATLFVERRVTPKVKPPITQEFIDAIFKPHPAQMEFFWSDLHKRWLFASGYGMSKHKFNELVIASLNTGFDAKDRAPARRRQ